MQAKSLHYRRQAYPPVVLHQHNCLPVGLLVSSASVWRGEPPNQPYSGGNPSCTRRKMSQ